LGALFFAIECPEPLGLYRTITQWSACCNRRC